MKQTGILFKPFLIPAIENGNKWVTRRLIDPQPSHPTLEIDNICRDWNWIFKAYPKGKDIDIYTVGKCRFGQADDLLYLKEGYRWAGEKKLPPYDKDRDYVVYQRDEPWNGPFVSPRFFPKFAARTWLKITGISVERLNLITEAEAVAEGMNDEFLLKFFAEQDDKYETIVSKKRQRFADMTPQERFARVWNYVNPKSSWVDDCEKWTWRIAFEKVK